MKQITDIDQGVIRRVDWQELVPPTLLLRAFSATFKTSFLILGAVLLALAAWASGWRPNPTSAYPGHWTLTLGRLLMWPDQLRRWFVPTFFASIFVGAWFALALSRSTVVRLTSSARSSILASSCFALNKFRSIVLPALLPIACGFAIWLCEFVTRKLGAFGEICAPLAFAVCLCLSALCLIGVLAFPFATTAVAAENSDCFDAVSRGISYVTQRLLFLAIYALFSVVLTLVGLAFVDALVYGSLYAFNSAYLGSQSSWVAFWRLVILLMPLAYCLNCAVVYTNAIYILLRRSVDGTPFDSCVLDLQKRKPRQLREILVNSKGAPEFADSAKREGEKAAEVAADAQSSSSETEKEARS